MHRLLSPEFPVRPKMFPFYYGWVALGVAIVGMLATAPGQTIGFSVFTDSLMNVSHLNRMELCTAYFLGTMCSSFMLKWVGRLYDRYGGRILMTSSGLGLAVMLLIFSNLNSYFSFLVVKKVPGLFPIAMLTMTLGFFGMRFLGQGVLMLTSRNLIGKWFLKRRGLVSAFSGLSISVGFALVPPFFLFLINRFGWSKSYQILSLVLFVVVLLGWTFYRDNPEECGLQIDGTHLKNNTLGKDRNGLEGVSLQEAKKSMAFWSTCLGMALHGLTITAISFHITDIARLAELGQESAIAIFIPIAIVSGVSDLLSGWLADRFPLKFILAFMMAGASLGYTSIAFFNHTVAYWLAILGVGISNGCYGTLSNVAMPHFFGRKYLGEISGYMLSCLVFATSLGPIFFAICTYFFDSYTPAMVITSIVGLINLILALQINPSHA
ncbi:MAG: MFS transporter [Oligoflexales bacterium]